MVLNVAFVSTNALILRRTQGIHKPTLVVWGQSVRLDNARINQTAHHPSADTPVVAENLVLHVIAIIRDGGRSAEGVDSPMDAVKGPAVIIVDALDPDWRGCVSNVWGPGARIPYQS